MNKLLQGDCVEVMTTLADKSIDLVVTSPPYDNLRTYDGNSQFDFQGVASQLFRIVKDGGVVVWVVGDQVKDYNESGTSFRQALGFKDGGWNLCDTMIYHKPEVGGYGGKFCYAPAFEYMFVFSKGKPKTINLIRDKLNKGVGKQEKRKEVWGYTGKTRTSQPPITKQYGRRTNVWFYNVGGYNQASDMHARKHPAIFPEALAHDHIVSWSNKGDIVLDPFMGSGTTCKMAKQLERHYIGIEINLDYIEIAKQRLANMDKQKELCLTK